MTRILKYLSVTSVNEKDIPKQYIKAVKSAVNILNYADKTEKKLKQRLIEKGYNDEQTDYAVHYVKEIGLLNDTRLIGYLSERLANVKLYGKRRIAAALYEKGFEKEDIYGIDYSEIDFISNCAERIRRTGSKYKDKNRLTAALVRYGFSYNEINEAFCLLEEEETDE